MFRTARIDFIDSNGDPRTDIFRVYDNPFNHEAQFQDDEVEIAVYDAGFRDFRIVQWEWVSFMQHA